MLCFRVLTQYVKKQTEFLKSDVSFTAKIGELEQTQNNLTRELNAWERTSEFRVRAAVTAG